MPDDDLPVIDLATARTYIDALRRYCEAEAEGEPLPDDALTMAYDLSVWAATLVSAP